MMKAAVWGCGYLGVTQAVTLAELGVEVVVGVDTDVDRVAMLAAGRVPFFEPGLDRLVAVHTQSGGVRFVTDVGSVADADIHFVCVGTPQREGDAGCDLSQVESAVAAICDLVQPGAVVVGKSTVPVGTASRLEPEVESVGAALVWNPEFLREGTAVEDSLRPSRVVIGVSPGREWAAERLAAVYEPLFRAGANKVVCDVATAELVKVAANSFLALKISFSNLLAEVCEVTGADVVRLADALGLDPRIGRAFLDAGLGFGGGCLPKDVRAFGQRSAELGVPAVQTLSAVVDETNRRARRRAVDKVVSGLGRVGRGVDESVVAVLGASFKPGSDDVRDSPSAEVITELRNRGATVRVVDPWVTEVAGVVVSSEVVSAVDGADAVLLATAWDEFVAIDPLMLRTCMRSLVAVDGRNRWDGARWVAAGFVFDAMGTTPDIVTTAVSSPPVREPVGSGVS